MHIALENLREAQGRVEKAAVMRSAHSYCSTAYQSYLRSQVKAVANKPGGYDSGLGPGKYIFREAPRAPPP